MKFKSALFLLAISFSIAANAQTQLTVNSEVPHLRELLAIELAETAADNGSPELSLEAFHRMMENFHSEETAAPVVSPNPATGGIQSSLLGPGPSATAMAATNNATIFRNIIDDHAILERVFELLSVWRRKKFDAERVSLELQQAVMPQAKQAVVRNYAIERLPTPRGIPRITMSTTVPSGITQLDPGRNVRSTTQLLSFRTLNAVDPTVLQRFREPTPIHSLGLQMIQWSAEAGRLEAVLAELRSRANDTTGRDAHGLIVMTLRTLGRVDEASAYVDQLLQQNKLNDENWLLLLQCSLQPLPEDIKDDPVRAADLAIATQVLSRDTRDRLLRRAMDTNLAATAPYYQYAMRTAIVADDIQQFRDLVPFYVDKMQSFAARATGPSNTASNALSELVAECFRHSRPYMALPALRYMQEHTAPQGLSVSSTSSTSSVLMPSMLTPSMLTPSVSRPSVSSTTSATTSLTQQHSQRLTALMGLCALPADKRFAFTKMLLLDQPVTSWDAFHFESLPDCAAPLYFRSREWQDAARLLKADPASHTVSLLDVLLSDAAANGQLDETIKSLFDKLPKDSSDYEALVRLLCEWMRLRSEVQQQPLHERVASALPPLGAEEFGRWFIKLPEPVRTSLAAHYRRTPDSVLAQALDRLSIHSDGSAKELAADTDSTQWSSAQTLKHWIGIRVPEPSNTQAFAGYKQPYRPWLISQQHELQAPQTSMALLLRYPLKGNVTLKLKVLQSGPDRSNNSFGGIINGAFLEYRGYTRGSTREIYPAINARLTSSMNSSLRLNQEPQKAEPFELACHYENNVVTLSIDGEKLGHTELVSQSFPFAGLIPSQLPARQSAVELVGSPEIAPQVNMLDASLSGWKDQHYDRPLVDGLQVSSMDIAAPLSKTLATHVTNWKFANGELGSIRNEMESTDIQSKIRYAENVLLYARPLLEGERFEYEAWQDSQTPVPSVIIGKTVLLVEAGQVRLHWLPTYSDIQFGGIDLNNRADDPDGRQLSEPKLTNDQWNKLSLRIEAGHMILNINATDVYRRPVPADTNTEFGWRTPSSAPSVRIRQATLTGPWPQTLPSNLWE